ncbi:MAG: cupin domain-containing protein [Candidatus Marinimicrobia bacterium]|nr:cupin domain-containing protein [Candidatus Neomarinimicrobiota bacterium]
MIVTKKLSEIAIMETEHRVDVRNIYSTKDAMINVITLKSGEFLKQHLTPVNVAFYVLKGTGIIEIGEEKETVSENTLIESPKDIMHCWYNESEKDLAIMVIKAPKPVTKSIFI